ncbi:AAA family ATPase Vps4 [Schizosaccharomyces osmophilus]|uniref:vesicle-fusing ATPase n=1 Tax=Schizosaccharomyces osmophilus TaxID=2545709 RepID=A0AAF0AVA1_9SCHI|nr:AAA family ATPase Vps4 [Schizosaccharomyces osmophilus]WBW71734.1 AAA family ATPase Vps4 [Schizosaccharomyces osmophilus]
MSNPDCLSKAISLVKTAIDHDNAERYGDAYKYYQNALDYFMMALKYEKNEKSKEIIRGKVLEYLDRAEKLKTFLQQKSNQVASKSSASSGNLEGSNSPAASDVLDSEAKKLRGALTSAILVEKPDVRWEDIAGLENAKEALKETVLLPIKLPQLFSRNRKPWSGILLYGPPGTGKSYLAKAVATEAGSTFFSISSSDLVSKWMGESERLVRQLFEMAREQRPSIIFIDEIDSLCGSRSEGESESSRRIKTEFLVQMNGVGKDESGVLVLGATNIPWTLDSAIRRRFEKRIYIPLPGSYARSKMFELNVGDIPSELKSGDFKELAKMTEGYSGSDIAIVVRDAIMEPVRRIHTATHFKKVFYEPLKRTMVTPCSPGDSEAYAATWMDVNGGDILEPRLTVRDFYSAVKKVKPTLNAGDIQKHIQFTKDFGAEG